MDELDRAKRRYPVGDHIRATVTRVPRPGTVGVFVDLGSPPGGFIDVGQLPWRCEDWPPVGTELDCEVLQHRPGQVRLWPLDPRWRNDRPPLGHSAEAWEAVKDAHPVGSLTTARVTAVYPANREYCVEFDGVSAALDYHGAAPVVGETGDYRVTRHLDATRQILLAPNDSPDGEPGATPRQDAATPD